MSDYLTYGYDEFGNDLGKVPEETGIPNPYDRQGVGQPFGYTGYRYDEISGSYFAQAREYKPEAGRFTAEDVIKGNGAVPITLNQYGYCWGNPLIWVDLNGLWPAWFEGIFAHLQFEYEFLAMYHKDAGYVSGENIYGSANVYIPLGGVKGGKGFADVVLYNEDIAYIYEIKPESHYRDAFKQHAGENQLENYIRCHSLFIGDAYAGEELYVEPILFMETPFVLDSSRKVVYRMYPDSEGMIYYEIIKKGENESEESTVLSKEEEEAYKAAKLALIFSVVTNLEAIAGMIEEPDNNNIFSSIFSPEAIIKSFFSHGIPISGSGGNLSICPA